VENLALVVKDESRSKKGFSFYAFESLTLCPIDLRLVKKDLLTGEEIQWLDGYHRKVREALMPRLGSAEQTWLKKATQTI
jgi:Xaa-Pro aminopeptidase